MTNAESLNLTLVTECRSHAKLLNLVSENHTYWRNWKKTVSRLKFDLPHSEVSLVISVLAVCQSGQRELKALIDTGAAVPLVFKTGLFAEDCLKKSVWPVKFVTASGTVMTGGTSGCKLEIWMTVSGSEGPEVVACNPLWAYEADLKSCDLIIGYPFLSGFGLGVDPCTNSVFRRTSEKKVCQYSLKNELSSMSLCGACRAVRSKSGSEEDTPVDTSENLFSQRTEEVALVTDLCNSEDNLKSLEEVQLTNPGQKFYSTGKDCSEFCVNSDCECRCIPADLLKPEVWSQGDSLFAQIKELKSYWFVNHETEVDAEVNQLSQSERSFQKSQFVSETYAVTPEWFRKIVNFSDLDPTVDAFASEGNQLLDRFWTKSENAFEQNWSSEVLWINPPFSKMELVVQKILLEQAEGILIIPCWERHLWFTVLESIAVKWLDIPHDVQLFRSIHGRPLKQRSGWRTRAVVFNAFGALSRFHSENLKWSEYHPVHSEDVSINNIFSLRQLLSGEKDMSLLFPYISEFAKYPETSLSGKHSEEYQDPVLIRSVIESTEEHPDAKPYIAKLQSEYHDVLFEVKLAKDVNPESRGPFGVARIELCDNAVPQKRKPFRMIGEKEAAFKYLIEKFLDRGWIEPSDSE